MERQSVIVRVIEPGGEVAACALARRVFAEAVAPSLDAAGVEEFNRYAEPLAMLERLADNHTVLVAKVGGELAGIVEVRRKKHIAMLFVESSHRGKGLGSALLRSGLSLCEPGEVTVHAEPNAVRFYSRHGFVECGGEQVVNGLRFVPMAVHRSAGGRGA